MAKYRKHIDRKLLRDLCLAQLTNEEIAHCLRLSVDTLMRRYAEPIKAWKRQGVSSVRRELFTTAMSQGQGKGAAMIFFLKNYGGMADNQERKPLELDNLPVSNEFDGIPRNAHKPN